MECRRNSHLKEAMKSEVALAWTWRAPVKHHDFDSGFYERLNKTAPASEVKNVGAIDQRRKQQNLSPRRGFE